MSDKDVRSATFVMEPQEELFASPSVSAADPTSKGNTAMAALAGCTVLVVEDEPLVALDIADAFKAAGAQVIISRTLQDALHQAATANLSAAVIDHALHDGVTTSDVCAQLKERDIPFIVYSGFSKLEGACAEGKLVHKPASPEMLLATLQGVLANQQRCIN